MYKFAPLLLALAFAFTGCGEAPPPEEPKPEAPPEPSAEQLRGEYRQAIQVLSDAAGSGVQLPPQVKDEAVSAVNQLRSKHAPRLNGPKALQDFMADVEGLISRGRDGEAWMSVKGGCEIYRALNAGSTRYEKLEQKADIMLSRPQVAVTGFVESDGVTDIFVRVSDTQVQPSLQTYTVREGEEFHEKTVDGKTGPVLKVVRIVGANSAVELEYLPIHDTWEVEGPKQF